MCTAAIQLVLAKYGRLMNTENWWNDNWQGHIEIFLQNSNTRSPTWTNLTSKRTLSADKPTSHL